MKETGRKIVLFNADDLGRTIGINEGIVEAHRHGVVRGATLMVGMPAVRDAVERMTRCPHLGVGLHITLSGAEPTLPASGIQSLLGADGRFPAQPEGLAGAKSDEILAEVRNQFALFVRLTGRLPTHLDSHHHSHRMPRVLDAVVAVAKEHGLPVRRASPAVALRLEAEGIRSSDRFVEGFFGERATLETLLAILREAAAGTTEVMCHPGHPDEVLRRESTYAEEREREIALLTHPDALRAVEELGIELAHFGDAAALGGLRAIAGHRGPEPMRVEIFDHTAALVARAGAFVAGAVARRDDLVLGLPTGRTMVPFYSELARRVARGQLDLSRATAFNLDEVLLPPGHAASFRAFMESHAWAACGFDRSRCHIPNAGTVELAAECARYEKAIADAGGLDLAILGLGVDGHVAYNLPGPPASETHVVELPEIVADSLAVPDERRPLRAITVGIGTLKTAREILLLATTPEKARALRALREGPADPAWPCSLLREHPALSVLATRQAIEGGA